MESSSTAQPAASAFDGDAWFDPIEQGLRGTHQAAHRGTGRAGATAALGRGRYERGTKAGYRNGTRERSLLGSFGPVELAPPRVRLTRSDGKTEEWHSVAVPRYARMTRQVEALIAAAYLSGTHTRRVKRALGALFKGAVGKNVVSRAWRKLKADWRPGGDGIWRPRASCG